MRSNAVVKPLAMMVELFTATITRSAMLRPILYITLTDATVEIHRFTCVIPFRIKLLQLILLL